MIENTILFLVRSKIIMYFLFSLITIVILLLTQLPSEHLGNPGVYQYDKLGHFVLFFSWTLAYGFLSFTRKRDKTNIFAVFLIGSVFGVAIEYLQEFLPYGRNPNIYDAIADILGSLSAAILLYLIKKKYLVSR